MYLVVTRMKSLSLKYRYVACFVAGGKELVEESVGEGSISSSEILRAFQKKNFSSVSF